MTSEHEELLDVVDNNDQVIGTIPRSESGNLNGTDGRYIRCVSAFIVRGDGAVWVPVRSPHKRIAPGGLDYGCGGFVASGETYDQTLLRELAEEADLHPTASDIQCITIHQLNGTPPFFEALYAVHSETQPKLSDEHGSGSWMTVADLRAQLEAGAPAKSSLLTNTSLLQNFERSQP